MTDDDDANNKEILELFQEEWKKREDCFIKGTKRIEERIKIESTREIEKIKNDMKVVSELLKKETDMRLKTEEECAEVSRLLKKETDMRLKNENDIDMISRSLKNETEARIKMEEECRRLSELLKKETDTKLKAEEEYKRLLNKEVDARIKVEEELRVKMAENSKVKSEQEIIIKKMSDQNREILRDLNMKSQDENKRRLEHEKMAVDELNKQSKLIQNFVQMLIKKHPTVFAHDTKFPDLIKGEWTEKYIKHIISEIFGEHKDIISVDHAKTFLKNNNEKTIVMSIFGTKLKDHTLTTAQKYLATRDLIEDNNLAGINSYITELNGDMNKLKARNLDLQTQLEDIDNIIRKRRKFNGNSKIEEDLPDKLFDVGMFDIFDKQSFLPLSPPFSSELAIRDSCSSSFF